ncbi:hypothetical protein NFI96_004490 [Prochilodus magdalenae]|nr:hypothetical protein NFI96_004490 [Prochilodus magdalenae]
MSSGISATEKVDGFTRKSMRKAQKQRKAQGSAQFRAQGGSLSPGELSTLPQLRVPADGAVGVEVEGHQVFWTCDKRFISVLTTVPPHTDSLAVSTKTKAGLVTEDDPLPF